MVCICVSLVFACVWAFVFAWSMVAKEIGERLCVLALGGDYSLRNSRWHSVKIICHVEQCVKWAGLIGGMMVVDYLAIKGVI